MAAITDWRSTHGSKSRFQPTNPDSIYYRNAGGCDSNNLGRGRAGSTAERRGDQQKIDAYCEFADLTEKFDQAVEEENTKKAEELFQRGEELQKKLGPEFAALADGIRNADVSSHDVREISSIIGNLNEHCGS